MKSTVLVEMFGLPADTLKGEEAFRVKNKNVASSNKISVTYIDDVFSFENVNSYYLVIKTNFKLVLFYR